LREARIAKKYEMSREEWLRHLSEIANFDVREYLEVNEATGEINLVSDWKERANGHVLEEIQMTTEISGKHGDVTHRVRLKRESKLRALEMLGKALGYLTEKVEHSGSLDLATMITEARRRASGAS
jgi:hypothetical protein